jgi:hypothetical protein
MTAQENLSSFIFYSLFWVMSTVVVSPYILFVSFLLLCVLSPVVAVSSALHLGRHEVIEVELLSLHLMLFLSYFQRCFPPSIPMYIFVVSFLLLCVLSPVVAVSSALHLGRHEVN